MESLLSRSGAEAKDGRGDDVVGEMPIISRCCNPRAEAFIGGMKHGLERAFSFWRIAVLFGEVLGRCGRRWPGCAGGECDSFDRRRWFLPGELEDEFGGQFRGLARAERRRDWNLRKQSRTGGVGIPAAIPQATSTTRPAG